MTDQNDPSAPHAAAVDWYYEHDGVVLGPVTEEGLREAARVGQIKTDTLVWQDAFDHWEDATSITSIAEILGCTGMVLKIEPSAVRMRVEPQKEPPPPEDPVESGPSEELGVQLALGEAVSDDEAADPVIDVQQARAILERASIPPPRRASIYPTECSIPPASTATEPPPAPAAKENRIGLRRAVLGIITALFAATVCFGLAARSHRPSGPTERREVTFAKKPPVAAAREALPTNGAAAQASGSLESGALIQFPSAMPTDPRPSPNLDGYSSELQPSALGLELDDKSPIASQNRSNSTPDALSAAGNSSESLVTVDGPLDASLFQQRLQRSLRVFDNQCWTSLLVRVPNYDKNPSIRIQLSVDRTGHVYDVKSGVAPRGYFGVGRCIGGRMRGWKFPAMDVGTRADVVVTRAHN